jgi:hypothetical protein
MDFAILASKHSKIDTARSAVVDAYCHLAFAATLAHEAGNVELSKKLADLGHRALALDFTIPPPKR